MIKTKTSPRLMAPVASLTLALLIGVGGLVARAREPRADTGINGPIGSIDMEQVYNESRSPEELEQAAQKHEQEGAARINKVMAVPFLEANELEEYGAIIGKQAATPAEDKRAVELKALSDKRGDELKVLQGKDENVLAPADKTRMQQLIAARRVVQTDVRAGLISDFRAQQESWVAVYRHQQIVKLREEVAKVAKEKGIAHVFDANTLVYSVNDLTPQVLQRINRRPGKGAGKQPDR